MEFVYTEEPCSPGFRQSQGLKGQQGNPSYTYTCCTEDIVCPQWWLILISNLHNLELTRGHISGCFQRGLTEVVRPPFHRLGSWTEKIKQWGSTSIHLSLPPDCEQRSNPPTAMVNCTLKPWAKTKPLPLQWLLAGVLSRMEEVAITVLPLAAPNRLVS